MYSSTEADRVMIVYLTIERKLLAMSGIDIKFRRDQCIKLTLKSMEDYTAIQPVNNRSLQVMS